MTNSNSFEKLEKRRTVVEELDHKIILRNSDQLRNYWVQLIIFSSAIIVGILPLLDNVNPILSISLAKIGLLVITLVCILIIVYFPYILTREKHLLHEQKALHEKFFSTRLEMLSQACKENWDDSKISLNFEKLEEVLSSQETDLLYEKLVAGRFTRVRNLIDFNFSLIASGGTGIGALLIILSFICY